VSRYKVASSRGMDVVAYYVNFNAPWAEATFFNDKGLRKLGTGQQWGERFLKHAFGFTCYSCINVVTEFCAAAKNLNDNPEDPAILGTFRNSAGAARWPPTNTSTSSSEYDDGELDITDEFASFLEHSKDMTVAERNQAFIYLLLRRQVQAADPAVNRPMRQKGQGGIRMMWVHQVSL
jgi:hypothetical protein